MQGKRTLDLYLALLSVNNRLVKYTKYTTISSTISPTYETMAMIVTVLGISLGIRLAQ